MNSEQASAEMRSYIQKIATGPEYSKNLTEDEARQGMRLILSGVADPVQAGVFLIALRMKRETDAENRGVLGALIEACRPETVSIPELVDIADPYDGFARCLPVSPFLPAVMAACGMPAVSHGLQSVGPKFGITHRRVLQAAGVAVDLSRADAAARLTDPGVGWAYLDQRVFCPGLHDLVSLRRRIVKRPVITTVEVLLGPLRGERRTHLWTGYVHKNYPPVYAELARFSGFDSLVLTKGVEGGTVPSLQQPARVWAYHGSGAFECLETDPRSLGIRQATRAVPLPVTEAATETTPDDDALARRAAEVGLGALAGESGPALDALVYGAAICLQRLERFDTLAGAAEAVRDVILSGKALGRFEAAL